MPPYGETLFIRKRYFDVGLGKGCLLLGREHGLKHTLLEKEWQVRGPVQSACNCGGLRYAERRP